jgi:hypothetical protein
VVPPSPSQIDFQVVPSDQARPTDRSCARAHTDKPIRSTWVRIDYQADATFCGIDTGGNNPEQTGPLWKSDGLAGGNLVGQEFQGRPGGDEGQVERPY